MISVQKDRHKKLYIDTCAKNGIKNSIYIYAQKYRHKKAYKWITVQKDRNKKQHIDSCAKRRA